MVSSALTATHSTEVLLDDHQSNTKSPGLWARHEIRLLQAGSDPFHLRFISRPPMPHVDALVAKGDPKTGKPYEERDMIAKRVGFTGLNEVTRTAFLFGLTWGEYCSMIPMAQRKTVPAEERFFCFSIACLLRTKDGKYPVQFRSKKVSTYPEMWHFVAGYADLDVVRSSGSLLPQVLREFYEELALLPTELLKIRQLGFCQHLPEDSCNVEMLFAAETNLTAEQVVERAAGAKDAWEGGIHIFDEEHIRTSLQSEKWNPAGAATAMLALGM